MQIKHAKTATRPDSGDTSLAQPSDWNADHTIIMTVQSVASAATITPAANDDLVRVTALAVGAAIANPSGTLTEGWSFVLRIKDNGTARALSWGSKYTAVDGVTLPTTTVVGKWLYVSCIYNQTDDKVDVASVLYRS